MSIHRTKADIPELSSEVFKALFQPNGVLLLIIRRDLTDQSIQRSLCQASLGSSSPT